jgi:hypothetical protein
MTPHLPAFSDASCVVLTDAGWTGQPSSLLATAIID